MIVVEIRQLRYFSEVYRTGSISLAAENLGLTQPALSQQLALLERELKSPLFERSKQGMRPTAAGEVFHAKVGDILQSLSDLENSVRPGAPVREITFAVGDTLAANFVPGLIHALRSEFADTKIRVIESNLTEIKEHLREDHVDFAFSPEPISERQYVNRYLVEDEIVPAVGAHDRDGAKIRGWSDLRQREWILFHKGSAIRKISDSIFESAEKQFRPKIAMELRSVAGVVRCLESGLGVGFISNLSLTENLTVLNLPQLMRTRRFYLTHKKQHESIAPITDAILRYAGKAG
jgi:DNA-binding transcriptional LysR family regulator